MWILKGRKKDVGYCVPCQHRHDVCCNVHAHNTSHKPHCIAGHLLCAAFAVAARFRVNCAVENLLLSRLLTPSPYASDTFGRVTQV